MKDPGHEEAGPTSKGKTEDSQEESICRWYLTAVRLERDSRVLREGAEVEGMEVPWP